MKTKTTIAIAVCAFASHVQVASAQSLEDPTLVGTTFEIPGVVEQGTFIEQILRGYNGLDDPIGIADGSLLFSEPDGLRIHAIDVEANTVSVLVEESNETHGIGQLADGRLVGAQAWDGSTRVGIVYPLEAAETFADEYGGMPFSRPNDLVVASDGRVYFTDPGLTSGQEQELIERYGGEPLDPRLPAAVYFIPPGDDAIRIEDQMIRPNGIQLSRDERTLYIGDSNGVHIIAWDLDEDGMGENRREFGTLIGRSTRDNGLGGVRTYADGMAVDSEDRLYVTTGYGVEVLSREGEHLGLIPVRCPPRNCQNLGFGGPNKSTLYVAGAGSLYRIEMLSQGLPNRAK